MSVARFASGAGGLVPRGDQAGFVSQYDGQLTEAAAGPFGMATLDLKIGGPPL
ncbi:MAG TPA: hypothetical protein VFT31_12855 [Kribbella sp.]|nr:hypothetical protein [Kribbella sp.]